MAFSFNGLGGGGSDYRPQQPMNNNMGSWGAPLNYTSPFQSTDPNGTNYTTAANATRMNGMMGQQQPPSMGLGGSAPPSGGPQLFDAMMQRGGAQGGMPQSFNPFSAFNFGHPQGFGGSQFASPFSSSAGGGLSGLQSRSGSFTPSGSPMDGAPASSPPSAPAQNSGASSTPNGGQHGYLGQFGIPQSVQQQLMDRINGQSTYRQGGVIGGGMNANQLLSGLNLTAGQKNAISPYLGTIGIEGRGGSSHFGADMRNLFGGAPAGSPGQQQNAANQQASEAKFSAFLNGNGTNPNPQATMPNGFMRQLTAPTQAIDAQGHPTGPSIGAYARNIPRPQFTPIGPQNVNAPAGQMTQMPIPGQGGYTPSPWASINSTSGPPGPGVPNAVARGLAFV